MIEKSITHQVYNWMQYFSQDTIADEFAGCGLLIEEFFDDVAVQNKPVKKPIILKTITGFYFEIKF